MIRPDMETGSTDRPPKRAKAGKATGDSKRVYQRPRGGEARGISDLMPEIGRAAFRRFGFIQSSVVTRWPEIAGRRYAAMSRPESIAFPQGKKSDGTLNLVVSGAHAVLMQHVEQELLERVNRFFGYRAVVRIRMRHGTIAPLASSNEPRRDPPNLRPVPLELGDSLRDIGDPELIAVLESLARSLADSEESEQAARGRQDRARLAPAPKALAAAAKTGNVKPLDPNRLRFDWNDGKS